MAAVVTLWTALTVILNVADNAPGSTDADDASSMESEVVVSLTVLDAFGAAFKLAVPIAALPPATVAGLMDRLTTWNGVTLRTAD